MKSVAGAALVRCRLLGGLDVRNADGDEVRSLLVHPKRLALFAYLLLRGADRLTRRDSLLALFWPESTDEAARHSLRQTLHALRQELGTHVLTRRGNEEVGVSPTAVWCDATEFERAAAERRYADAVALYAGALLDGFHASGVASELEQWFDDERSRLYTLARECARALTDEAEHAGDLALAAHAARDALRLEPLDEAAIRRLMSLLLAMGDRAEAMRAYEMFAARMAAELELSPSAETRAIAEEIRREERAASSVRGSTAGPPIATASEAAPVASGAAHRGAGPQRPPPRRFTPWLTIASVGIAIAAVGIAVTTRGHTSETLAVGRSRPSAPLTDATTTSLVARRFYDEGLRAFNQGDTPAALRLFRAALAADSTFVMAAYYASKCAWVLDGSSAGLALLSQAVRAAAHSPERERLIVSATWAVATNDPAAPAIAESLATRYPLEPDGAFLWGASLAWSGDRGRAIPILQQTVERDGVMLDAAPDDTARQHLPCRACDALANIVEAYTEGDSLDLAERAAREWTRRQPGNWHGWVMLAQVHEFQGRVAEALTAQREASRRLGHDLADDLYRARLAIRVGDFATADRLLMERATEGDLAARNDALWWLAISLRHQGRLREALSVIERSIATADSVEHDANPASAARMARAEILLELGRAREAGASFEAISAIPVIDRANPASRLAGESARRRAWGLALAATAYAAAGDTTRLSTIADTVAAAGRHSLSGRDRNLAAYVRGLMHEARRNNAAAEGEFRKALYSPNLGYTRVNVALARVLLAQHRPREAISVLRAALRGSLEGSCYYVTRTELQNMLAQAFAAGGQRDSAQYYRVRVTSALATHTGSP